MTEWLHPPHSAFVHMPLALAVLWPVVYGLVWWATSTRRMPNSLWFGVLGLVFLQVAASLTAILSGEAAKEESGAKADLLFHHEKFAEIFMSSWWVLAAMILIAWWMQKRSFAKWLHSIIWMALVFQAGLAVYIGHAGGALM